MNGEDLAVLITAVAISSAKCLSDEELELFAVIFTQLADTFATLAVIRSQNSGKTDFPPANV